MSPVPLLTLISQRPRVPSSDSLRISNITSTPGTMDTPREGVCGANPALLESFISGIEQASDKRATVQPQL